MTERDIMKLKNLKFIRTQKNKLFKDAMTDYYDLKINYRQIEIFLDQLREEKELLESENQKIREELDELTDQKEFYEKMNDDLIKEKDSYIKQIKELEDKLKDSQAKAVYPDVGI